MPVPDGGSASLPRPSTARSTPLNPFKTNAPKRVEDWAGPPAAMAPLLWPAACARGLSPIFCADSAQIYLLRMASATAFPKRSRFAPTILPYVALATASRRLTLLEFMPPPVCSAMTPSTTAPEMFPALSRAVVAPRPSAMASPAETTGRLSARILVLLPFTKVNPSRRSFPAPGRRHWWRRIPWNLYCERERSRGGAMAWGWLMVDANGPKHRPQRLSRLSSQWTKPGLCASDSHPSRISPRPTLSPISFAM